MPFGTLIRSWVAPGNAGSVHGIAWLGNGQVMIDDSKNNNFAIYELQSMTMIRSFAVSVGHAIFADAPLNNRVMTNLGTTNYWLDPGAPLAPRIAGPTFGENLFISHRQGRFTGVGRAGNLVRWECIAGSFYIASSVQDAPSSYSPIGALTSDGCVMFTATSGSTRLLVKQDIQTGTIVATATAPANDFIASLAFTGTSLLVSVGGAVDRIYEVSLQ